MKISSEYISNDYLHLNSCGIEHLDEIDTCMIREKGRQDYHILYVFEGRCYAEINKKDIIIESGNIILYRPGIKQKYKYYCRDKSISCYLHFSGTGCEELLSRIGLENKDTAYIGKSNTLYSIFEKMISEKILEKPFYNDICSAYLLEIFAIIGRKLSSNLMTNTSKLDSVCLEMYKRYNENLPIKYYSDFCNLSQSRFLHHFKEKIGVSPAKYITSVKIEKAKFFLLNTEFSISEISEIIGFSTPNYFIRQFKKYTGVSPKNYSNQP